jgi:hypothetical protein
VPHIGVFIAFGGARNVFRRCPEHESERSDAVE